MGVAHSRGIIHRDLKPANVMLGDYGETLVVDWGLARNMAEPPVEGVEGFLADVSNEPTRTRQGQVMGTPAYMAPEQAAGLNDRVGRPSDIYSLGAILYQILTGRPPFDSTLDVPSILDEVKTGQFQSPRQMEPRTPAALEAICLKAMSMRLEDRYATAGDLAAEVERWLADEPVTAYPEPALDRWRRWGRKHRTLVLTGALVLVLGVVG